MPKPPRPQRSGKMRIGPRHWSGTIARRTAITPAEFRELFQRRGPTLIKIGQFLALRPDLLPQDYCDELIYLLDGIPPFSWAQARTILEEDLQAPLAEAFAMVNPKPVAA